MQLYSTQPLDKLIVCILCNNPLISHFSISSPPIIVFHTGSVYVEKEKMRVEIFFISKRRYLAIIKDLNMKKVKRIYSLFTFFLCIKYLPSIPLLIHLISSVLPTDIPIFQLSAQCRNRFSTLLRFIRHNLPKTDEIRVKQKMCHRVLVDCW